MMLAFAGPIGPTELLIILLILLLLFGASKIPQLARSMGKGISEFKKGVQEGKEIESRPDSSGSETPVNSSGKE